MVIIRKSNERGLTDIGWLKSYHSFSFGDYFDPKYLGCGSLVVINEDKVNPNEGFDTHSHSNMEIISYIIDGELSHKDSMGNGSIIKPGEVQIMSAGTGVSHSEYNPSSEDIVHFLQIWIKPNIGGLTPSYQQKDFQNIRKPGKLTLIVSNSDNQDSLKINQNAKIYILDLNRANKFSYKISTNLTWIQVVKGSVRLYGLNIAQGDGVQIENENDISFEAIVDKTELLIFEL